MATLLRSHHLRLMNIDSAGAMLKTPKTSNEYSAVALLLIDVINDLDFQEAEALLRQGLPMAHHLAALKAEAGRLKIPIIYVNDNFGHWKSDFRHIVEHCCGEGSRGAEISRMLRPAEPDYFVLKPKHSGFYATTLDVLLKYLQIETLILTGVAANICVLFTANDAYMRDYNIAVPGDCVAANTAEEKDYSLRQIKNLLKGDIRQSTEINLAALKSLNPTAAALPTTNLRWRNRTANVAQAQGISDKTIVSRCS